MHINKQLVTVGTYVPPARVIGLMRNTSRSFGTHLHIQIYDKKANKYIDVADYIYN
ncbi:MAG TPA: hypothetical protein DCP51_09265 [Clostridiales bacterium]|nr:hypothetical protein [Clostridiales bacterium]